MRNFTFLILLCIFAQTSSIIASDYTELDDITSAATSEDFRELSILSLQRDQTCCSCLPPYVGGGSIIAGSLVAALLCISITTGLVCSKTLWGNCGLAGFSSGMIGLTMLFFGGSAGGTWISSDYTKIKKQEIAEAIDSAFAYEEMEDQPDTLLSHMIEDYQNDVDILFHMQPKELAQIIRESVSAAYFIPQAPGIGGQWSKLDNIKELMQACVESDMAIVKRDRNRLDEYRKSLPDVNGIAGR